MQNKVVSYEKAIQILTSQGKFYINLGLDRVKSLLGLYGNPQDKIKCIHVAGTNGKGSTCAMIASVLKESGYKTGLYTSPHLVDYTERVKINGNDILKEEFADLIFDIIQTAEQNNIHATEFEILTVLAFIFFCREKVDFAIIETGLGGRLDATNVIANPLLSIITSIDLDHVDRLGNTIEKISFEKAGIIKSNCPVITLKGNKGMEIIREKAFGVGSELILVDEIVITKGETGLCYLEIYPFNKKVLSGNSDKLLSQGFASPLNDDQYSSYELNLKGLWQRKNLALVLKAIEILWQKGIEFSEEAIKKGLEDVSWPARFQYIKKMNLILDGAHNPAAAKLLSESIDYYYPNKERIWIYSSISTKNHEEIMKILFRQDDTVILTQINSGAAVPVEILKTNLIETSMPYKIYTTKNIKEAVNIYLKLMKSPNIGIVAGSLYSAGSFLSEYAS
jgi:dihydrofolate synthase/folylpolyglutamate synthase